jgi:hypothetical protein
MSGEDGQFRTLLPDGELAFVVQAREDVRRFRMLDDRQEAILDETVNLHETVADNIDFGSDRREKLYAAIGVLQELANDSALKVNKTREKIEHAKKVLAAIR